MRFHRIVALGVVVANGLIASDGKTVWSGVYTSEQATRGVAVYLAACSRCHKEDLSGYAGLRGAKFIENWREDNLGSLWNRISKTMPVGAPGTLDKSEYLDILAYILQANDFPAGTQELNAEALSNIRFEGKAGAEPVPDFALVQTVGCLARDPDGIWRVKQASDPVRTRNPNASASAELHSAAAQPLGKNTFRILDGYSLKVDSHDGRKVKVKGFLIRKPGDDRLNATSVEVVGAVCR
jgi:mono/diheme cytochrome c family protein